MNLQDFIHELNEVAIDNIDCFLDAKDQIVAEMTEDVLEDFQLADWLEELQKLRVEAELGNVPYRTAIRWKEALEKIATTDLELDGTKFDGLCARNLREIAKEALDGITWKNTYYGTQD